jgi:CBS domain-containing protein
VTKGLLSEKISSLKLREPLLVETGTSVGEVVEQVQKRGVGYVLVCNGKKLIGIMTERDVLLKIVARDVDYAEPVDNFMTRDPDTLTNDATIGDGIALMDEKHFRHVPIVDRDTGEPLAVFSVRYVIDYLAESFPEQVMNLPPRPHQKMITREGA